MLTLRASADIEAPIERVYAVLTDFARYAQWSPFVVAVHGDARLGALLTLDVRFHDGKEHRSREIVDVLTPPGDRAEMTYRLLGPLTQLGLLRGARRQVLTRLAEGNTRYETDETFTGVLARFVPGAGVQRGFDDTARALKARAEQGTRR